MGSKVILNDTLRISKEQGFPEELDIDRHFDSPITIDKDKVFEFKDKLGVRNYKAVPIRNFLVQDVDGLWLYWGLVHIIEVTHDYVNKVTSGKFKIIHLYSPEEMKLAHQMIDRNPATDYFKNTSNTN